MWILRAHHGIEQDVDLDLLLTRTCVIDRFAWINPRVFIVLTFKAELGCTQEWFVEIDRPNALIRKGVNRYSSSESSIIEVIVYPSLMAQLEGSCS